jgi:hypothetical protein
MIVGIDSKKLVRVGKMDNDFIALLGIGAGVEDYENFKIKYTEIISSLFKKRNMVNKLSIYKSSTLKSIGMDFDFFEEFYRLIKKELSRLYIFLTILRSGTRVKIFPKSEVTEIISIEFMTKHLDSTYPHICAWSMRQEWKNKNRQEPSKEFEGKILLDDFSGHKTNAWNSISHLVDLEIFPNGDKVNPLISTADILINYLDLKLLNENKKIGADQIGENLSDFEGDLDIRFIGDKCLWNIIPLHKGDIIKTSSKLRHPTIFILRGDGKVKVDKKIIEFSPAFSKIIEQSYKNEGCCKFLDLVTDIDAITDKDFIYPIGDEAKIVVRQLRELGYRFNDF